MRILTLTNCPLDPTLGSGKAVIMYCDGLRRLGHEVTALGPGDYEWMPNLRRGKRFRQMIGAWRAVKRLASKGHYDILEMYGAEFWYCAWRLYSRCRRPLLVAHTNGLELYAEAQERRFQNEDDSQGNIFKNKLVGSLYRWTYRKALHVIDGLVCLCRADAEYAVNFGGVPRNRVEVIFHGVDDEFLGPLQISQRGRSVAYLGSWIPRKGIKVLVQVISRLLKEIPDATFDVYGVQGDAEKARNSFASELRSRVIIHPKISVLELARGLENARALFFPSRYEGFGLALTEAMARGCVPVTTPTGFGAELNSGHDGFVLDFNDTEGMTARLRQLLVDDVLWKNMSNNARQRVLSLRWDTASARLALVYSSWLERHVKQS